MAKQEEDIYGVITKNIESGSSSLQQKFDKMPAASSSGSSQQSSGSSGSGSSSSAQTSDQSTPAQQYTVANDPQWYDNQPSSDPMASPLYWRNLQSKFEADPYIDKDHPGYQDPDGWDKDTVDLIMLDLDSKMSGTSYSWNNAPSYKNGDPTWQMIQFIRSQNQPAESTGQVSSSYQAEQQSAPISGITGDNPQTSVPEPAASASYPNQGGDFLGLNAARQNINKPPAIASRTHANAPGSSTEVNPTAASAEPMPFQQTAPSSRGMSVGERAMESQYDPAYRNTEYYQSRYNTYLSLGNTEEAADQLALRDTAAEQRDAGIGGKLVSFGINSLKNWEISLYANLLDIGSDIAGVQFSEESRDNLIRNAISLGREDNPVKAPTATRAHYHDLISQGAEYYGQLGESGTEPPMSELDFAKLYGEYMYRMETGERYDPNIDLTDFEQYIPEDLRGLTDTHSRNYTGNPINSNSQSELDPAGQELRASIMDYVYGGDTSLTGQLDSIMTGAPASEQQVTMTQEQYDQALLAIFEANPPDYIRDMIEFDRTGSMDKLDSWMQQALYYLVPGTQEIDGANKTLEILGKPAVTAFMSAGITASFGEIVGGIIGGPLGAKAGKIIGFFSSVGIAYAEQLGLVDLPFYDQIMEFFDKGADWVESQIGRFALNFETSFGYSPFENPNNYYRNLKKAWNYSDLLRSANQQLEQDYPAEVLNIILPYAADLGVNFDASRGTNAALSIALGLDAALRGEDPEQFFLTNNNQVFRYNLGQAGRQDLDQTAADRLRYLLMGASTLYQMGMSLDGINNWANKTVTEYMGSNAFLQEITYNEATDPLNFLEGQQANAIYGIGKLTGDTNLQTAARANGAASVSSTVMSLLPPGMDTAVTQIAKMMGDEIHKPGGFNEIMGAYHIENQFGNLDNVTAFGRHFSGINADGTIRGLGPQTHGGSSLIERGWNGVMNFFSKTDDSRVLYETDVANTFINIGLANAKGDPVMIQNFLNQLQNPELITPDSPLFDSAQSAVFNTFKQDIADSARAASKATGTILDQWNQFAPNRAALYSIAETLGIKPDEVIDLAERYELNDRLDRAAQRNNVDPAKYRALADQITPFVKMDSHKFRAAWSPTELTFQISNALGDGMQPTLLNKYHILDNKKLPYQISDTVKAAQNLVFLGVSGTYLANNLINNVVTRGISGVGGISPQSAIQDYFTRMGIRSERFGDSIAYEIGQKSSGEQTQYTRMQQAISSRREAKNILSKIKKGENWVNQHLGIFGNLSGKVEELESKQAIYSGTKQYMDRTWRPGINLSRMPIVLENAINAQAPGMVDAIYAGIRSGLNMDEITQNIMGDFIPPDLKNVFLEAAAERFGGDIPNDISGRFDRAGEIINQMFEKTGLLDELKENLKGKKDAASRAVVFSDFARLLETQTARMVADHLQDLAESVRTDTTLEGFPGALEHAAEMVDIDLATRLGSMNQWDKLFTYRLREPLTVGQWQSMVTELRQKINADYSQLYAQKTQIFDGILTGLGLNDEHKQAYISALGSIQDDWVAYQQKQQQAFAQYRAEAAHIEGESQASWESRARSAWQTYLDTMNTAYAASCKTEMDAMTRMDQAFADGFKAATGLTSELAFLDQTLSQIRDLRQQEIDLITRIREQERTLETFSERDALWEQNEAQRKDIQRKMAELRRGMYDQLRPLEARVIGLASDPSKTNFDVIARAVVSHEEASKMKAALEKYSDRIWGRQVDGRQQSTRPEFLNFRDLPTVEEAETLFDKINNRLKETEGYNADAVLGLIYTAAGLTDETLSPESLQSFMTILSDDELGEIMALSARYGSSLVADLSLTDDVITVSQQISERIYPKIQLTDPKDPGQKKYRAQQNKRRAALAADLGHLLRDLAENGQASDAELYTRVNEQITAQDWFTLNDVAAKYNAILAELNAPVQPDPARFHTEQVSEPRKFGIHNIVSEVYDGDTVIALVPETLPVSEVHPYEDVSFPVIGIDPGNPDALVVMMGDEPRTLDPAEWTPQETDTGSTAYQPVYEPNTTPGLDPSAMAYQEVLYRDILPLFQNIGERYEEALNRARSQNVSQLDLQTRDMLRAYLDNVVTSDLSNTKFKAMRFGEMMRDIALLNYSDRYGFDNFLTMLFPYQFWMTRSFDQWMKRTLSHPRLFSHYQRIKEIEERNEKYYLPSRLTGKVGVPMPGWPSYLGGRTFFNPAQLLPQSTFLEPLLTAADDHHVAERKTETLLGEWLQDGTISYEEYQQAMTHEGSVWEDAWAQISSDTSSSDSSLFSSYFSAAMPVTWALNKFDGKNGKGLGHFPSTNVGEAASGLISRLNPGGEKTEKIAQIVRDVTSSPERALRRLYGFTYNEFGDYANSLIARQLRSMVTEGRISAADFDAALLQKDGNAAYDEAVRRVREELMYRVPMAGAVAGVEDLFRDTGASMKEKWANVLLNLALSPFGQYTFNAGEETERRSFPEKSEAIEQWQSGINPNALKEYYAKYPAAGTYSITNTESEDLRNRYALYDIIKSVYYSLDDERQQEVQRSLGPKFYDSIISKETRAIETMPLEDLVAYARALNGTLPYANMPFAKNIEIPDLSVTYAPDSVIRQVQDYDAYVQEHFPGISKAQTYYYSFSDKGQKKQFLAAFPLLQQYWDWKHEWENSHPEASAWITGRTASWSYRTASQVWENLDPVVQGMVMDDKYKDDDVLAYYIDLACQEAGVTRTVTPDSLRGYVFSYLVQ